MKAMLTALSLAMTTLTTAASHAETRSVTLPMQLTQHGHVMVDVQLNSAESIPMVVDTAASVGVMSNNLLNELALPDSELEQEDVHSATSTVTLTLANVNKTRVGSISAMNLPYVVQDLTGLNTNSGKIPGILGYGFLEKQCTVFDFTRQELTFYADTCPKSVTQDLKSSTFWLDEEFIKLNVMFNGHRVDAVLDTGSPANIINSHLLAKLNVEKQDTDELKGLHSKAISKQKLGDVTFNIGEHTVTSHRVAASDMPVFKKLGYEDKPVMLMGLADFKNGKLVVDYRTQHIYF